ncbi:MAG: ATP-binding protein [Chthoniobacter sp.]|uniref:ATP-binding protein n=1 Tax=Chthoniobacter sp. TaxID=2510640 RepID=UPI0032A8E533
MRTRLRSFPIQRKLRLVILATCTAALCVASSALFALQFYFFQRDFRRDLVAVGEIVATNSTAVLKFADDQAARENLASLKAKPHITGSALVLKDGTVLASVGRVTIPGAGEANPPLGFHNQGDDIVYVQPILLDGERLGTLILHADYSRQANKLHRLYASILVAVLSISFLVAVFVSWKLERVILDPIQNLAETARHIMANHDYSVRATKVVDDEVGTFTDSFNSMLDQIQTRDTALLHEIAERKRAEEELQRAQSQLIDASRQAGMAEVATGVLHNVGNVLNSVNVSATLIAERLGQSRTANLARAAAMLRDKNGQLADFLANDPKGQLLPAYLADLSQHLENERLEARAEIDLLTRNIEHIKDIVAMQQTYARVSGLSEVLPVESLIEDALQLNMDSFTRHRITVVREYDTVPPVSVDKHKALQILVNLLRNSKHAMDDSEPHEKRLTLKIRQQNDNAVAIIVTDTGVGIAAENLTRIFSHGFTTRKDGHGFGLHSAALAAQQMGGRLLASSDGPGRGATFTFELPLAAPASAS